MTKLNLHELVGQQVGRTLEGPLARFLRTTEIPEYVEQAVGVAVAAAFETIFGLLDEGEQFSVNGVTYERDLGVLWLRAESPDGLASCWIEVYRPGDAYEMPGENEGGS